MIAFEKIEFSDNPSIQSNPKKYMEAPVHAPLVVQSYRASLFSYEWLDQDGKVKLAENLPEKEKSLRESICTCLENNSALPKAILGIGMLDNIEFGAGRAEFLTLAQMGLEIIPVHILKSQKEDFKAFLADVD